MVETLCLDETDLFSPLYNSCKGNIVPFDAHPINAVICRPNQ